MLKVMMHGCNGKMGRVITELVQKEEGIEIVAGVDRRTEKLYDYPVYDSVFACKEKIDVVIDFSNATAINALLKFCVEKKIPIVLCTTGLSDEQIGLVKKASEQIAVLYCANMSMGIQLLRKLLKDAAKVLFSEGYDVEIIEKHHREKKDAPSGTALLLADVLCDSGNQKIGIHSVRGGTIVGEHEVIFAGMDEVITFKHTAYSRVVFARGAVEAAGFLAGQPAGVYDMSDVIGKKFLLSECI